MCHEFDPIPLSGLQHYRFCLWHRTLTHAEQAWDETARHGGGDCECLTETSRPESFRRMADIGI
jgi:hypothetical protein